MKKTPKRNNNKPVGVLVFFPRRGISPLRRGVSFFLGKLHCRQEMYCQEKYHLETGRPECCPEAPSDGTEVSRESLQAGQTAVRSSSAKLRNSAEIVCGSAKRVQMDRLSEPQTVKVDPQPQMRFAPTNPKPVWRRLKWPARQRISPTREDAAEPATAKAGAPRQH